MNEPFECETVPGRQWALKWEPGFTPTATVFAFCGTNLEGYSPEGNPVVRTADEPRVEVKPGWYIISIPAGMLVSSTEAYHATRRAVTP